MHKDFFPKIYGGENKITLSSLQDKLSEYFGDNTYSITCKNINGTYYLKEIRLKLDLNFVQLIIYYCHTIIYIIY